MVLCALALVTWTLEIRMRVLPAVVKFCVAALLMATPALADTYTYTYTGHTYQIAFDSYNTSERLTGSVTLAAPLGIDMSLTSVPVLSFSFSDGVQTLTQTSPGLLTVIFDFGTRASGLPAEWNVQVLQEEQEGFLYDFGMMVPNWFSNQIQTLNFPESQQYDYDFVGMEHGGAEIGVVQNNPGGWVLTVNTTPGASTCVAHEPGLTALVLRG